MTTSAAVALFPLVEPFEVPPVRLPDLVISRDYLAHGMRSSHNVFVYCACCDEWRIATAPCCPECSAPFNRSAA